MALSLTRIRGPVTGPRGLLVHTLLGVALLGCASDEPLRIELMPAPDVYAEGGVDPFLEKDPFHEIPWSGVLYATDRAPVPDAASPFYQDARGHVLRLGVGQFWFDVEEFSWEAAERISLLKNRTDRYPLRVKQIDELGVLADTYFSLVPSDVLAPDPAGPGRRFADLINTRLASASDKDVFIYVHGYKVNFENPLLVGTELWHFLGYEGVVIAYAWPSTPDALAYAADLESARYSARNLRLFVEYLARETEAERIHILGYSAGTRLVVEALHQMALLSGRVEEAVVHRNLRLGQVILVASDVDPVLFAAHMADGVDKVGEGITLYESSRDRALDLSARILRRSRLGQIVKRPLPPGVADYLRQHPDVVLVDVSEAENIEAGNGHAYFRQSPWVSSDLLMTLRYRAAPGERGLVRKEDGVVWTFPESYESDVTEVIYRLNPALRAEAESMGWNEEPR